MAAAAGATAEAPRKRKHRIITEASWPTAGTSPRLEGRTHQTRAYMSTAALQQQEGEATQVSRMDNG